VCYGATDREFSTEGTQKGGLNILPGTSPQRGWYAGLQYNRGDYSTAEGHYSTAEGYYSATEYILQYAGAASIIFSQAEKQVHHGDSGLKPRPLDQNFIDKDQPNTRLIGKERVILLAI
jgi:hypothetical protein